MTVKKPRRASGKKGRAKAAAVKEEQKKLKKLKAGKKRASKK